MLTEAARGQIVKAQEKRVKVSPVSVSRIRRNCRGERQFRENKQTLLIVGLWLLRSEAGRGETRIESDGKRPKRAGRKEREISCQGAGHRRENRTPPRAPREPVSETGEEDVYDIKKKLRRQQPQEEGSLYELQVGEAFTWGSPRLASPVEEVNIGKHEPRYWKASLRRGRGRSKGTST